MIELIGTFLYLGLTILSIAAHEVAHGFAADRLGDSTARLAGRLTLNPLKHIDPVGSLLVPALLLLSGSGILFGWAKPVPVRSDQLNDPRVDEVKVALAGPATNFLIAAVAAMAYRTVDSGLTATVLLAVVQLNVVLALFNLLPIPPLDGSRLLALFLPEAIADELNRVNPIVLLGILLLVVNSSGVMNWLQRTVGVVTTVLLGV